MEYRFTFVLEEEDYLAYNRYHVLHTPLIRRQMFIGSIVCVVFFLLLGLFLALRTDPPGAYFIFGLCSIIAVSSFLLLPRIHDRQIRSIIKLNKRMGKLMYDKQVEMTFFEDQFCEVTPESESKLQYSMLERIGADANGVYLYIAASQAFIIPQRAFDSQEQKEQLLQELQSRITPRA